MQLSQEQKTFSPWNLDWILNIFKKEDDSHNWFISEIMDS